MATTDLMPDFYFDNVPVHCPSCDSEDVAVYAHFKSDDNVYREARCAECNVVWEIA